MQSSSCINVRDDDDDDDDDVMMMMMITAKLSRVVCGLEIATEALELEARRHVPLTVGVVEPEGDLELVVLLRHGYLVVLGPQTKVEDT